VKEENLEKYNAQHQEWLDQIDAWRREHRLAYAQKDVIKPQYVVENSMN
jgi:outer membrane biogenesis lipoprotein LolB